MRCKNCKDKFEPKKFNWKWCDKEECNNVGVSETLSKARKKLEQKKRLESRKAKESLLTHKDYLKLLQTAFNAYIRKRDEGLPCVSCGKEPPFDLAAGHFYSAGNYSFLRFNELNVHGQCNAHCNMFLGGNIHEYRKRITNRISQEDLKWLDDNCHKELRLTINEIKQLINKYKNMCRALK